VKALKNIQKSTTLIEADFYKEVQKLEAKYHKLYQPFYDQRKAIVSGKYEPTDAECHWSDGEESGEFY
jgi:nucleosome assembly protein 1-like 1